MGVTISASQPIDQLTASQEASIARYAGRCLAAAIAGSPPPFPEDQLAGAADLPVLGAFVTVKRSGHLRGCCGFLGQNVSVARAVAHAAQRTAGEDPRFPPVSQRELRFLDIDVWLLTNQQVVEATGEARLAAIEIGRHGVQVARGDDRGLLLPGVAVDHHLDARAFLEHVCIKAQLPASAWREDDTLVWTFEGRSIHASLASVLETFPSPRPVIVEDDVPQLAGYCRDTLLALLRGATPTYYASHLPDGNVHGVAISLVDTAGGVVRQASRLSLRNTVPLQTTIFHLIDRLARSLRDKVPSLERAETPQVVLSLFHQPALHGTVAQPDLMGVDVQRHLISVYERAHWAALFDSADTADSQVEAAAAKAQVRCPESAHIYSFEVVGGLPGLEIAQVFGPAAGEPVRPPAVAGCFYPAIPSELNAMVKGCLPPAASEPEAWPALMVPHAGLVYSGRVAGQTLSRVKIPSSVVVIGPKHTPHGVEWAAAPCAEWSLPGATVRSDICLAGALCQAIDGLEFDAAAHAQEHAIEVELPLLAHLSPETKVVGIVIGGGSLERCRQFAAGLASVVRSLREPPLLVISSDMNHFASDAETRRLDDIALTAMEACDPERFYRTVVENHITMCGVLPAVIVMETLRQLKRLNRVERVAYATSGDANGDLRRAVGYAGVLLGE